MDPVHWRNYYQACQPHIPRTTVRWELTEDGTFIPAHPVRFLPNGLIDVSNIAPCIADAIQHNETASPLLKLPAELRRKIYSYTFAPNLKIILRETIDRRPNHPASRHTTRTVMQDHDGVSLMQTRALDDYINLPRVCRLLYTDTALLLYACTEVEFSLEGPDCVAGMHKWLSQRRVAQKEEISSFSIYVTEWGAYANSSWDRAMFSQDWKIVDMLPRLKRLDVKLGLRDHVYEEFVRRIGERERREGVEVKITDMYWMRVFGMR